MFPGYCHLRKEYRTFRIERIVRIKLIEDKPERRSR